MKKTLLSITMVTIIMLSCASPAFSSLSQTTTYEIDGTISFEKQAGHKCNSGAEIKQTIYGNGLLAKTQTIAMIEGKITMEDDNNWVAGATPLTVTTVWDLCAAPKNVFRQGAVDLIVNYSIEFFEEMFVELDPEELEEELELFVEVLLEILSSRGIADGNTVSPEFFYDPMNASLFNDTFEAISDQIWAVQVQADPGFSGSLYQNGEAAYGPSMHSIPADVDYETTSEEWRSTGYDNAWAFGTDKYGVYVPISGPDYVGNYFNMEQHARTSQGTLKRYISISSPFNHGYLMEDVTVTGKSDVQETFSMMNIEPGAEMPGNWWSLF